MFACLAAAIVASIVSILKVGKLPAAELWRKLWPIRSYAGAATPCGKSLRYRLNFTIQLPSTARGSTNMLQ